MRAGTPSFPTGPRSSSATLAPSGEKAAKWTTAPSARAPTGSSWSRSPRRATEPSAAAGRTTSAHWGRSSRNDRRHPLSRTRRLAPVGSQDPAGPAVLPVRNLFPSGENLLRSALFACWKDEALRPAPHEVSQARTAPLSAEVRMALPVGRELDPAPPLSPSGVGRARRSPVSRSKIHTPPLTRASREPSGRRALREGLSKNHAPVSFGRACSVASSRVPWASTRRRLPDRIREASTSHESAPKESPSPMAKAVRDAEFREAQVGLVPRRARSERRKAASERRERRRRGMAAATEAARDSAGTTATRARAAHRARLDGLAGQVVLAGLAPCRRASHSGGRAASPWHLRQIVSRSRGMRSLSCARRPRARPGSPGGSPGSAAERQLAREQLVEHDPEASRCRCARRRRCDSPAACSGAHVGRRAQHLAVRGSPSPPPSSRWRGRSP